MIDRVRSLSNKGVKRSMATREEKKHFWHWVIVILLVLIALGQLKLYRGQQALKKMVSEGLIQLKEEKKNSMMPQSITPSKGMMKKY